ncbi:MAG: hypothetical protein K2K21_15675 [Lachnospiraceae bacterium]|nr:hypothetical protein [Lachnospiraceae bacterium]
MSVTGITNRSTAINTPYQQAKKSNDSKTGTYGESSFRGIMNAARTEEDKAANKKLTSAKEIPDYMGGINAYAMETRLTSGIIGFGGLDDGTVYSASYDEESTIGNPIVNIRLESKNGKVQTYKLCVNQVDWTNATPLEMFALCSHADKMEMSGNANESNSYSALLYYANNSMIGGQVARNADEFLSKSMDWSKKITDAQIDRLDQENKIDASVGKSLRRMFEAMEKSNTDRENASVSETKILEQALLDKKKNTDNGVPYNYLAKDGIIEYNGVVFVCDEKYKAIRLGDTSDPKNCLNIPLSGGGSLIVNRDNLDDLAKAIGMFTPEDVNLIMRAIAQDAKVQQMKHQIDDETSGIDLVDEVDEEETTVEEIQEFNLDSTVYKNKEDEEKENN